MFREFAIAKELRIDERNAAMTQAWHGAAFQRAEKMPSLERVLARTEKKQTASEQRNMLEILSQQYGGKVRKVSRPKAKHGQ